MKEFKEHFKGFKEELLKAVSDYKWAFDNPLLAEEYGGVEYLRQIMFDVVEKYDK